MASNKSDACCWYLSARLQLLQYPSQAKNFCHESSRTLQVETEKIFWNELCSTSGGWNCKKFLSLLSHLLMLILLSTHRTYLVLYINMYIPEKVRSFPYKPIHEYTLLSYSAGLSQVFMFSLFSKISLRAVSNPQGVVLNCSLEAVQAGDGCP